MARDSKARLQLELVLLALDGTRPSGILQWGSAAAPVVTQAAVGAGHWGADPRTTMRYDRARGSLDRHATYIVAAYVAGAAR